MKKILVIAPHPDDEVLGCGGAIKKYALENNEVYVCVVTKAYAPDWPQDFLEERPKEIDRARKILGVKKVYFLDYPTVKLDTVPQKNLVKSISEVIKDTVPDTIFIPHKGDINKDHRLIFEASLVAARPTDSAIKNILSYEILSESEWGNPIESFAPNVYMDISETFDGKIEAMKAYVSELRDYPHPRSLEAIEALAKKRGSEALMKFAEAFELIRAAR